ncbi:cytochrome oxidase biogenesis protein Surf1, facilitates heme A insertion [Thioclava sp. DLFJ5-1]|uniref:SURF1 family protein n=1 Tax=Thioclava sp. DLFJ5-1 TaxID=1915314 RepID=UPI0009986862|nr:SURF1 family protein [Thioclava sp. DLFJ5-1]OOY22147.1 cytochrome oxidase biogenesis protein Surf1, facilitates heme A insertion [Thioclava sp. DLFJ5-1]
MMKRYIFPLLLGIVGCAILISLGIWQVQRLGWKEAMLAEISAKIEGQPQALPPEGTDTKPLKYEPVTASGRTTGQEILVLSGQKGVGAGYRVIDAFETDQGRKILLDRGFIPEGEKGTDRPVTALSVIGNLHWPEETDSYTPEPDAKTGIWFARDVPAMAAKLGTEPILIVARTVQGAAQGITPVPVTITGIPNDHLGYAITWFLLAIVWAGMTIFLLWRIRRQQA